MHTESLSLEFDYSNFSWENENMTEHEQNLHTQFVVFIVYYYYISEFGINIDSKLLKNIGPSSSIRKFNSSIVCLFSWI
jgi:hypothetical protein